MTTADGKDRELAADLVILNSSYQSPEAVISPIVRKCHYLRRENRPVRTELLLPNELGVVQT